MANRDIIVLNTTQSRAETQQSSDTVRIKGGSEILSIENSSASQIVKIQSSGSSTTVSGKITSTSNISGSITASFGRIVGTTLIGNAFEITNTDLPGTLSSSAQIADRVTGSFRNGFEFTGEISGSIGSTGSFGHIHSTTLVGDAFNLQNTDLDNTVSGSAQLATRISQSFNKGFEFSGKISGSSTSTGSFGRIEATTITGDGYNLTNYIKEGTVSSSAQIATQISGSFNKGFEFTGTISGSSTSTGSFGKIVATTLVGDVSNMTNTTKDGTISSSAQIATQISGSFNKGFNYTGRLGSTLDAWSAGGNLILGTFSAASAGTSKDSALRFGGRFAPNNGFCTNTEEWNGTNWSEVNDLNDNRHDGMAGGSSESALFTGGRDGSGIASPALTEYWNGTNWTEKADLITPRKNGAGAGTTADIIVVGGEAPSATTHVELYNLSGNAWSETTEAPTAVSSVDATGTQNSTFIASDAPGSSLEWNGSAWSTAAGSIVDRASFGLSGTVNDAVQVGASSNTPTKRTCTEKWNGYSWSVGVAMTIGQSAYRLFQGTGRSAVQFGSSGGEGTGCVQTQMYEASDDFIDINTLTAQTLFGDGSELTNTTPDNIVSSSAQLADQISGSFNKGFEFTGTIQKNPDGWSAGPNMIFARSQQASAANCRNGMLVFGGRYGNTPAGSFNNGAPACVEEYNGTSWSEVNDLPSGRYGIWGAGHSESGLAGDASGNSGLVGVEYYNGTNWAEVADLITAVKQSAGTGDGGGADAAVVVGGSPGSKCFQKYDLSGDSWSELADPIFHVASLGATGPSDAVIIASYTSPGPPTAAGQCWPGTTWASFSSYTTNRAGQSGIFGTQNDSIVMGGSNNVGNNRCCTEAWDGTSWSECNAAPTGISGWSIMRGNSGNAGLAAGTSYSLTPNTPSCGHHTWNGVQLWDGGYVNSGSFGRVDGIEFVGSGSNITNLPLATDSVSGSAQLAGQISGAFTSGFEFAGEISGSSSSSGSFSHLTAKTFVGDGSELTNTQLDGTVSGSAQLANQISGAFTSGFEFTGIISGSSTSTGSFAKVVADKLTGDASLLTGIGEISGRITSSAQIATRTSGSFQSGFEYSGEIRTAKGAWSVGASPANGRHAQGAAGVQSAMLAGGGAYPGTNPAGSPNYAPHALSEEYNGSAWSETNDMITARAGVASAGTQNAALFATGDYTTHTEEYNGTSYATGGSANQSRQRGGGAGTQTAGLAAGGYNPNGAGELGATELYDGAAWSNTADLNNARAHLQGGGSQNASIMIAGYHSESPANLGLNCTELWNGTTWTEVSGQVGTVSYSFSGGGTVNAATKTGGRFPNPISVGKQTERWNGVSWAIDTDLPGNSRGQRSGGSTPSQHMTFGGDNSGDGPANYEYNDYYTTGSFGRIEADDVQIVQNSQLVVTSSLQLPVFASNSGIVSSSAGQMWFNSTTKKLNFTMDVNSWSAGGNMILARHYHAGAGTQNAAIAAGGLAPGVTAETELYDGSAWSVAGSEAHDLDTARLQFTMTGNQNSALAFGGRTNSPTPGLAHNETETFNGSAWTEVNNLNTLRHDHAGFGTQNAAVASAGKTHTPSPSLLNDTEEWNGTNWTAAADNNTTRSTHTGAGSQNSGIIFGGNTSPAMSKLTETYDGTSWTEVNDMNTARNYFGGGGTQNAGVAFGGDTGPSPNSFACTEEWNGTSWSVANVLPTGVRNLDGAGSQASAIAFGGYDSEVANQSYEYSVSHLKTVEIDGV